MTLKQTEYLRCLGYVDTQEVGALLEHKSLLWDDRFAWKDETFQDVLFNYSNMVKRAVVQEMYWNSNHNSKLFKRDRGAK